MNRSLLIGALALSLSLPLQAASEASEFNQVYQAYQEAVTARDSASAQKNARRAYELGAKIYGTDSIDYANLGLNLANQLSFMDEGGVEILQHSLAIYEAVYGKQSKEVLDVYLALLKLDSRHRKSHIRSILKIGEKVHGDDSLDYADLLMTVSRICMRDVNLSRKGRSLALDALEIVTEKAERETLERVEAEYLNGNWAFAFKKREKATEHFSNVIELLEAVDYSHPYALASHSRLVALLEQSGRSDDATAHCLAIAQMKPWDNNQKQTPLYRVEPKWPISNFQRSEKASVMMDFTIDKAGFVKDITVRSVEGSERFVKPSIEALQQWRYAPKFVDGKPVEAKADMELSFRADVRG